MLGLGSSELQKAVWGGRLEAATVVCELPHRLPSGSSHREENAGLVLVHSLGASGGLQVLLHAAALPSEDRLQGLMVEAKSPGICAFQSQEPAQPSNS